MKALAIDTAKSQFCVSAKNCHEFASFVLDVGTRQSEKLLPAIDCVLAQVGLEACDLDYAALASGPGSFTSLRLAFSALKGIQGACGTPIYGINTLDLYAAPFLDLECFVVSALWARSDSFFAKVFFEKKEILSCANYSVKEIAQFLQNEQQKKNQSANADVAGRVAQNVQLQNQKLAHGIFVAGDAEQFFLACEKLNISFLHFFCPKKHIYSFESLFCLAEKKLAHGEKPLLDFEGPQYFKQSEAERKNQGNTA